MKNLLPFLAVLICAGCAPKNEFDITPAQASKVVRMSGPIDPAHLPPGAEEHEKTYRKGDVLPDGTISPGERKLVTIEMKK